jgi:hypothetical protein
MNKEKQFYWNNLSIGSKRIALLWLYILRSNAKEARSSYLEAVLIDRDITLLPHKIPKHVYMMNQAQLLREIDKNGGPPKWINGAM